MALIAPRTLRRRATCCSSPIVSPPINGSSTLIDFTLEFQHRCVYILRDQYEIVGCRALPLNFGSKFGQVALEGGSREEGRMWKCGRSDEALDGKKISVKVEPMTKT